MSDVQQTAQAAARALKDAAFKQDILEGKQDFPEVRDAIVADLAEQSAAPGAKAPAGGKRLNHLVDRAKCW
jgi:hypothetical protein